MIVECIGGGNVMHVSVTVSVVTIWPWCLRHPIPVYIYGDARALELFTLES